MSTLNNITTQLDTIKTDVVTCHANLKTTLIAKGVEVSETDKMSNLIDKVGSIATGKKWASGTGTISSNTTGFPIVYSGSRGFYTLSVNGLDFKPSTVIVFSDSGGRNASITTEFSDGEYMSPTCRIMRYSNTTSAGQSYSYNIKIDSQHLFYNGFFVPAHIDYGNGTCTWIAYE